MLKANVLGRVQMSHAHKRIVIPLFQCFKNTSESKTSTVGCELHIFERICERNIFIIQQKGSNTLGALLCVGRNRKRPIHCCILMRTKNRRTYCRLPAIADIILHFPIQSERGTTDSYNRAMMFL